VDYLTHLLATAGLALEYGANEDEAIAALLHDAIEDQGGAPTRAAIRAQFGDTVAAIVEGCSEILSLPKPPWRARKEGYLQRIPQASPSVRLVSAADKLHNARSLLRDYRRLGESLWQRFTGGKEGTLWFYRTLADEVPRPRSKESVTNSPAPSTNSPRCSRSTAHRRLGATRQRTIFYD